MLIPIRPQKPIFRPAPHSYLRTLGLTALIAFAIAAAAGVLIVAAGG